MYLIVAYGLAVSLVSVALILDTGRVVDLAIRYCNWPFMHGFEILINAAFGGAFLFLAEEARYPMLFKIYGGLLLVIGLGLAFVPPRLHRRYGEWSIEKFRGIFRPVAPIGVLFGILVIYSAI